MIYGLNELNDKVTAFVNHVVKETCEKTSTGNWCFEPETVCEAIGMEYEDYLKYQTLIKEEMSTREELLDIYMNEREIDVIAGLAFCPDYEWSEGDEAIFRSEDEFNERKVEPFQQPLSLSRQAEISEVTIKALYDRFPDAMERKKIFKDELKLSDEECKAYKLSQFYDNDLYVGKWRVHLVFTGEHYGLNDVLIHDKDRTLIEFYDTNTELDYDKEHQGIFTGGRYYVETILCDGGVNRHTIHGLQLEGSIPEWFVSGDEMRKVFNWLREQPLKEVDIPSMSLADKLQKANFFNKGKEQTSEQSKNKVIDNIERE